MTNTTFSINLFLENVRDQKSLKQQDIQYFISHLSEFPDEQIAAFLTHAFHKPLSDENKVHLTLAMRDSGLKLNWSHFDKPVVDKHSTGGVGDKITICLAPLVAALGMAMPTIAGRGLGHSGGTVDKLEAIDGMSLNLSAKELEALVQKDGFAFGMQTADVAPADKKLYALRDITATVESIPLITASILAKKLAESLDCLILDVKWGTGAFMQTREQAKALAKSLVQTAHDAGTNTRALITNMNQPLGEVSGNWCETAEAIKILQNDAETLTKASDTYELTIELAAHLLIQANLESDLEHARQKAKDTLHSGKAYEIFCQVISSQGGNVAVFEKPFSILKETKNKLEIKACEDGYIQNINVKALGQSLVLAKAGRLKQQDQIDHNVSLQHPFKIGSHIEKNQTLCTLYYNDASQIDVIKKLLNDAFQIGPQKTEPYPFIEEVITK